MYDIIEIKRHWNGQLHFQRVVKRSGLRVYDFLLPREFVESPSLRAYLETIENDAGYWETVFGGVVLLHLPATTRRRPRRDMRALLKDFNSK